MNKYLAFFLILVFSGCSNIPAIVVPTYMAQTEESYQKTQMVLQITQIGRDMKATDQALTQLKTMETPEETGHEPYFGRFDDEGFLLFCKGIKNIFLTGGAPEIMRMVTINDPVRIKNGDIAFIEINGQTNMSLTHQWGTTKAFVGLDFFDSDHIYEPSEDEKEVFGGMMGSMLGYSDPSISGNQLGVYLEQITDSIGIEKDCEFHHNNIAFGLINQFSRTGQRIGWSFWVESPSK